MDTKLTLTIEKSIIERAKSYAKNTGRSLSDLVEKYFENLIEENNKEELSPKLRKIVGAVKLPKDFDEKRELRTNLENKYL
jgi:hypothetical protein